MRTIVPSLYNEEMKRKIAEDDLIMKSGIPIICPEFTKETGGAILGQLGAISASAGVGKSRILSTAAMDLLKAGKRVMYFSVEEKDSKVFKRFERCPDFDGSKMDLAVIGMSDLTRDEIESLILKWNYDYIIFDYIDCGESMLSNNTPPYLALRYKAEFLKHIAEKNNKFILTATQLNKISFGNNETMTQTCLAESSSIANKLDYGYIMRCSNDREITGVSPKEGIVLQSYKLRNNEYGDRGTYIYAHFDRGTLKVTELGTN